MADVEGCLGIVDLKSQKVITAVNFPLLVSQSFKPGSVIKILTAIAAINSGKVNPDELYKCSGKALFDDLSFDCWLPKGHANMNLTEAIAQSCNLYFYHVASKLDIEDFGNVFLKFGIGKKTVFNLPGESPGVFNKTDNALEKYYLALGRSENLLVTPLQMLYIISVIASKGYFAGTPFLLDNPQYAPLYRGLRKSAQEGTARESNFLKMKPAGKTGTFADKFKSKTSAWFAGYAPNDKPEIAIVIFIKKGRGATNAAPIAKKVFKCYYDIYHR